MRDLRGLLLRDREKSAADQGFRPDTEGGSQSEHLIRKIGRGFRRLEFFEPRDSNRHTFRECFKREVAALSMLFEYVRHMQGTGVSDCPRRTLARRT